MGVLTVGGFIDIDVNAVVKLFIYPVLTLLAIDHLRALYVVGARVRVRARKAMHNTLVLLTTKVAVCGKLGIGMLSPAHAQQATTRERGSRRHKQWDGLISPKYARWQAA